MRASLFVVALAATTSLAPSVAGAAGAAPKFNITANCKAEVADGSGIGETLESCIHDEQQARDQLGRQWSQFSNADKMACIKETSIDGTPSYVEMQTCLEMSSDAKARSGDGK